MLLIQCQEYLETVKTFAKTAGREAQLQEKLDYLGGYAEPRKTECHLFKDFAPMSFAFTMNVWDEASGKYEYWFNGGLIFHGKHDGFGSGSAPTFAVTLGSTDGWSVHT